MPLDAATYLPTTVNAPSLVYCHTSPSGKKYVGWTAGTMEARWAQHVQNARSGRRGALYNAIRRYGPEAFTPEVLATFDNREDGLAAERQAVADLGTLVPAGYNVSEGGEGGHLGPAWAKLNAAAGAKRALDPVWRAKMAAAGAKRAADPAWRAAQAAAGARTAADPAWRAANAAASAKRALDPEWRAKMAEVHGDPAAPPATAAACLELFRTFAAQGRTLSAAHIEAALLYPEIPQWQAIEIGVKAGHNRNSALMGYTKATGAAAALAGVTLDLDQTAAAAVAAWPAVLAAAEADKAAQIEGGKKLTGVAKGATKQALTVMALRFAAVPAAPLARALSDAHGGKYDHNQMKFTRQAARRAAQLCRPMCPILAAALSVEVPGGSLDQSDVVAARARQAAAINAARKAA